MNAQQRFVDALRTVLDLPPLYAADRPSTCRRELTFSTQTYTHGRYIVHSWIK